jgi:phosphatidylserine/phosphatidylglycerophosphate/cardiolipin synthase-like enzyme
VAAVTLAVAGCKVDVPAAAGTGSAGQAQAAGQADPAGASSDPGPTRAGPLIIEPGAGFSPVYSLINGARRSIDVTMYEFADITAEHDLAAAARRGVDVRVILDQRELIRAARRGVDVQICGENEDGEYDGAYSRAYSRLARAGIHISYYSSSAGFYVHGKVIEATTAPGTPGSSSARRTSPAPR